VAASPAEKAGLKKGDIVMSLDGRPIWELPKIQLELESKTGPVTIGILRDGKEQTVDLQLGD
jgi:S1-C subfamily serine protease